MDFGLSEEQEQLQDQARDLLARECPSARVRKAMESAGAHINSAAAGRHFA